MNNNSGADEGPRPECLLLFLASAAGGYLYNRKSQEAKKLWKETEELKQEKERLSAALLEVQDKGEKFQRDAEMLLKEVEQKLKKRQAIYCSYMTPRAERLDLEKNMVDMVKQNPVGFQLKMEDDLRNIFQSDTKCGSLFNTDETNNGSLMWVHLKNWKKQVEQQKRC